MFYVLVFARVRVGGREHVLLSLLMPARFCVGFCACGCPFCLGCRVPGRDYVESFDCRPLFLPSSVLIDGLTLSLLQWHQKHNAGDDHPDPFLHCGYRCPQHLARRRCWWLLPRDHRQGAEIRGTVVWMEYVRMCSVPCVLFFVIDNGSLFKKGTC